MGGARRLPYINPRGSEYSIIKYLGKYLIFKYSDPLGPKTVNTRFGHGLSRVPCLLRRLACTCSIQRSSEVFLVISGP